MAYGWGECCPSTRCRTDFHVNGPQNISEKLITFRDDWQKILRLTVKAIPRTLFSPIKSYIIIGGLGGFGLQLVQWMVEKGAKYLVINSRNGLRDNYQEMIIERMILNDHANIIINDLDAANEDEAQILINLANSMAEFGGIFNLAMVLKDEMLHDQTVDTFKQVCRPKYNITFNKDKIIREKKIILWFSHPWPVFGEMPDKAIMVSPTLPLKEYVSRDGLQGLSTQWGLIGDANCQKIFHIN